MPIGKINPVKVPASMAGDASVNPVMVSKESHDVIKPAPINMAEIVKQEKNKTISPTINSADFAAKITNKVNQTVKQQSVKPAEDIKNSSIEKRDYVTDDQFFDDFFADDDD